MKLESIKAELHRHPFKPFKLVLADGRELRVPHHDHLLVSPDGETLFVYVTPSAFTMVDTFHVTQLIPGAKVSGRRR